MTNEEVRGFESRSRQDYYNNKKKLKKNCRSNDKKPSPEDGSRLNSRNVVWKNTFDNGFRPTNLCYKWNAYIIILTVIIISQCLTYVHIIIRVFCPRTRLSLQTQAPRLQFCQRQVFHRKLRNQGCSFTRDVKEIVSLLQALKFQGAWGERVHIYTTTILRRGRVVSPTLCRRLYPLPYSFYRRPSEPQDLSGYGGLNKSRPLRDLGLNPGRQAHSQPQNWGKFKL